MTRNAFLTRFVIALFLAVSKAHALEIMAYNVENLFDTEHDEGKQDYEYLPQSNPAKEKGCRETSAPQRLKGCLETNWTAERLDLKLDQIHRVVYEGVKHLPAIMTLEEVENDIVVTKLAEKLGYDGHKTTNGPDERGIDVAFMYDSKQGVTLRRSEEHVLKDPIFEKNPTRNILEGHFSTPKGDLILFVNHWPSQNNPVENRLKAAMALRELMEKRRQEFPEAFIIATGDFNTVDGDRPHPFKDELLSHGDIVDIFKNKNKDDIHPDYQNLPKPQGTYFYKKDKEWNFLDRFFVIRTENGSESGLKLKADSWQIVAPYFAMRVWDASNGRGRPQLIGTPWPYNHNADRPELAGFSDHFPIIVTVE